MFPVGESSTAVSSLALGVQFNLLVAVPTVAALLAGKRVFIPDQRLGTLFAEFVRSDWKYLGAAAAVTQVVNALALHFHAPRTFTGAVYAVEGATVAAFQAVATPPLTYVATVIYLVGFPFIVLLTYFVLKARAEEEARRYALAYVLTVVSSVPFFLLFPVKVSSLYLSGVEPLMYQLSPAIRYGIYGTDTLVKAFPSLHTGLSVLAALYARKADAGYARAMAALAFAIVLSTLYLGIHWLADAAFAGLLVAGAYLVSQRVAEPRWTAIFREAVAGVRRYAWP
ncbi:phosphatase PAP2 family protein [Halorussus salilacus]|uniref:phosphatase PAP2 family protein n=1 Tax=Halorussus salilacus TaxID=2953750 RepID=UPI00209CF780|nr:phosphatase PAP2 family protein [Halorussus salilacus]USZ68571.1 phosphatase PAP2 family protein [Halorussus salilacus]